MLAPAAKAARAAETDVAFGRTSYRKTLLKEMLALAPSGLVEELAGVTALSGTPAPITAWRMRWSLAT